MEIPYFKVMISDKGTKLEYIDPINEDIQISVLPRKLHNVNPYQENPYIIHMKNGKAFVKKCQLVGHKGPEIYILLKEFVYEKR
jgi:hypothetical protein